MNYIRILHKIGKVLNDLVWAEKEERTNLTQKINQLHKGKIFEFKELEAYQR